MANKTINIVLGCPTQEERDKVLSDLMAYPPVSEGFTIVSGVGESDADGSHMAYMLAWYEDAGDDFVPRQAIVDIGEAALIGTDDTSHVRLINEDGSDYSWKEVESGAIVDKLG